MKNETYMKKSEEREFGYEFARRFLKMEELIEKIKEQKDKFLDGENGEITMGEIQYLLAEYEMEVE